MDTTLSYELADFDQWIAASSDADYEHIPPLLPRVAFH
jgi:hypothetical protein